MIDEDVTNQSPEDVQTDPVKPQDKTGSKWYVVHVKTGYESKAKQALDQRVTSLGVEDKIFDIVIPTRENVVVKKGKKTTIKEKVFPGYILVKMVMNDETWLVVKTTEGITGFVGAGVKPTPISEKEVEAIMKFVQQEQPK
ncbi:MAG: transcription termination/antitermination NusG family protein, partial [Patescibacteria group bacterium]